LRNEFNIFTNTAAAATTATATATVAAAATTATTSSQPQKQLISSSLICKGTNFYLKYNLPLLFMIKQDK
jgi:hypothetical protein